MYIQRLRILIGVGAIMNKKNKILTAVISVCLIFVAIFVIDLLIPAKWETKEITAVSRVADNGGLEYFPAYSYYKNPKLTDIINRAQYHDIMEMNTELSEISAEFLHTVGVDKQISFNIISKDRAHFEYTISDDTGHTTWLVSVNDGYLKSHSVSVEKDYTA